MSYMHIDNLYKNQEILQFRECYAMEKIHGTSAHVSWNDGVLGFFVGGCKHDVFVKLFDVETLTEKFKEMQLPKVVVYGEAYGGNIQGMKAMYGSDMKFVAFEVKVDEYSWLSVPQAEDVCGKLGIAFVAYERVPTDLVVLDAIRDSPSEQARRNGCGEHLREGIVLRPTIEVKKNNGGRIIAKHKSDKFSETASPRKVNALEIEVLKEANEIAHEWVTEMRLSHVLDAFPNPDITNTGDVIKAMISDIQREGVGEFKDTREARVAIGKATAKMFKNRLQSVLYKEEI